MIVNSPLCYEIGIECNNLLLGAVVVIGSITVIAIVAAQFHADYGVDNGWNSSSSSSANADNHDGQSLIDNDDDERLLTDETC